MNATEGFYPALRTRRIGSISPLIVTLLSDGELVGPAVEQNPPKKSLVVFKLVPNSHEKLHSSKVV
jgi:hypothetical protein